LRGRQWTPCFRVPLSPRTDLEYIMKLAEEKSNREEEQLYFPPRVCNGVLQSGHLVSGGMENSIAQETREEDVVVCEDRAVKIIGEGEVLAIMEEQAVKKDMVVKKNEVELVVGDHGNMEEAVREECAGIRDDKASDLVEEEGVTTEGSANDGENVLSLSGIKENRSRSRTDPMSYH